MRPVALIFLCGVLLLMLVSCQNPSRASASPAADKPAVCAHEPLGADNGHRRSFARRRGRAFAYSPNGIYGMSRCERIRLTPP